MISSLLAELITTIIPATFAVASTVGVLSEMGFYSLVRNTLLPTRENGMADYESCIILPRF